jgi:PAS domain S-box-containing protein
MAEREQTTGDSPRGDASRSDQDAARGKSQEGAPASARPESAPAAPRLAELRDVNEQLLIAGLREQALAAALEVERARLDLILASIEDAVVVVDQAGTPVRTNAAYDALFGGTGDAVALRGADGQPLPPDETPLGRAARGETFSMQFSLIAGDPAGAGAGTRRWLEANGQRLHNGGAERAVVVIRDITAQSQHRRLQDEFLATMSHNLQTPLTAARAALSLLEVGAGDQLGADERELLTTARHNIERLRLRIAELLAAGQLDAGTLHVERDVLDLRGVIASAVEVVHPLLHEKGQTLALALPEPLLTLGDPRWLEQAVVNLLANAHRYTPAGTQITIAGRAETDEVRLDVRDNGPGIPAAELEAIFERFHRVARAGEGMGLGLYIVRAVIARHQGRVWAESTEGQGTAFHIALPRVAREAAPA